MIKAIDEMLKLWAEELHAPGSNGGGYAGGNLIAMLIASKGEVVRGHRGSRVILDRVAEVDRLVNRLPEELKTVVVEHYLNRDSFPSRSTATAVAAATPSICACMWRTRVSRTACCGGRPEFLDRILVPPGIFQPAFGPVFLCLSPMEAASPMHSSGPCTVEAGSGWRIHPFRQSMPGFSISEVGTRLPGCLAKVPRAVYHPHIVVRLPPIAVDCREGIAGLGIGR